MKAIAIEQEMLNYFLQLNHTEQLSIVQMLKAFLHRETDLQRVSIEEYNKEIDKAMQEVNAGKYVTMDALEKEMQL